MADMRDDVPVRLALEEGFEAAVLDTAQIPTNPEFRKYCEEDLCGRYGRNYSCPPACGTPEELRQRILQEPKALILKSEYPIRGYDDREAIERGKQRHNLATLRLYEKLHVLGYTGFCGGSSCCGLCSPCEMCGGKPCSHPDRKMSCLSAYCVDVAELARRAGLTFAWDETKLYGFGFIAYHREAEETEK